MSGALLLLLKNSAASPAVFTTPSLDWRQPILAGFDSGGSIGAALATSSTNKSLPFVAVTASPTVTLTITSGAVTSGSAVVTVIAPLHGLSTGALVRVASTTTTPASNANGLWPITVVDVNTFTYTTIANFTVTSASIGGTYKNCTGTTRDFSVKLDTLPTQGAFLYYIIKSNAFTLTIQHSGDSTDGSAGSGSWTPIAHTPYSYPGQSTSAGPSSNSTNFGGAQAVTQSGWKRLRIIHYDDTIAADFLMCAGKQASGNFAPDLTIIPGTSIIAQDIEVRSMRKIAQQNNPNRDPVFLNMGYPGAKVSDFHTNMVNTFGTWGVTPGIILSEVGPNDVAQGRPYSTDSNKTRISTALITHKTYIDANWPLAPWFVINCDHWNVSTAPAANDLANPENGTEPYNDGDVNPWIKSNLDAKNWNTTYQRPVLDEQTAFALLPPAQMFVDGTTHPAARNYDFERDWYKKVDSALFATHPHTAYIQDVLDVAEAAGAVPSWYKTRLTTILGFTTGSVSSLATRAAALATSYVEPSGTKPTAMATQPFIWADPADFSTLTLVGGTGLVSDLTEKSTNAGTFTQATTTLRPQFRPPNPHNKMGALVAANDGTLPCNSAAIIGALDAVSQQFMVCQVLRSYGGNATGAFFGWGVSTTQTKLGLQCSGTDELGSAGSGQFRIIAATGALPNGTTLLTATSGTGNFAAGVLMVVSVAYDGTNIVIRINGTQVGTVAWAKPAWTADRFTLCGNAAGTSRMAAMAGDFVGRADYNLTDLQTIEAYLKGKWGIA